VCRFSRAIAALSEGASVKSSQSTLSIPNLRNTLNGRAIAPGDAGYDEARTVFSGTFDRRPAVIVRPAGVSDVVQVVKLARETGLPLAVRSGGHSGAGHSTSDGGIVLDLRDLTSLDIDQEARTAWAGAGLTAGEYSAAVGAHGLATGFGDTGSVGIGGITLGGGIGYLTRKHGLTIDSVLAAEIVTAQGDVLHLDAASHPELFWAIRGGGGNFGVVTRFQYRLHPVDQIVGGTLMLPATREVITGAIRASEAASEDLSVIVNVMSAPPMPFIPESQHGKLVVMFLLCYAGDAEDGARAIAPFRALAEPIVDMVRPMRYPEIFPPEDSSYHPTAVGKTMFLDTVDGKAVETMIDYLQRSDASMRVVQLRVLGGAMTRVPGDATAFAHRDARILAVVAAFYNGPDDRPDREAWMASLAAALHQGKSGAYVGFVMDDAEPSVRAAYPDSTWNRLAKVKARYDPANLFRLNHNIPPVRQATA
jgi:FAD/FMN-containing dehydrogenase